LTLLYAAHPSCFNILLPALTMIMGVGTGGTGWDSAHPGNFSRGLKTSSQ